VDVHFVGTLCFADRQLAIVEASFVSALQQTYSVVGTEATIELPHDAFIPWEKDALFTLRGRDQEMGQEHIISGVDEYQLMVEHFSESVLGQRAPRFSPEESVRNMRVLDGLGEAARTGRTIEI
jgi:predicted dehydrogenase